MGGGRDAHVCAGSSLDRLAIRCVGDDGGGLLSSRTSEGGAGQNLRWQASLSDLQIRCQWQKIRAEAGDATAAHQDRFVFGLVVGAGFLHIITPFFFVFPGVIAYKILGPNLKPADSAYLTLVQQLVWPGLRPLEARPKSMDPT